VKLSLFEQRLVTRVLQDGSRLLDTISQYPWLQAYWQDLLRRYRGLLLAELENQLTADEEEVAAADTLRGQVRPVLAGPRSAA
jgi:hypothetical protein